MKMAYSIKDDNHIPRNATYWKNQAKLIAEDREKMAYVLAITRSNILSLKHNSGIGVVVYDAWLNEVNMALGIIENDKPIQHLLQCWLMPEKAFLHERRI